MAIVVVGVITLILLTSFIFSALVALLMGHFMRSIVSNCDSGLAKIISGYVFFVVFTSVIAALAYLNRWGVGQAYDYIYYTVYSPHLLYRWWSSGIDLIRQLFLALSLVFFFLEAATGYFSNQVHLWRTRDLRRIGTTTDQHQLLIALEHPKPEIRNAAIARLTELHANIPIKSLIILLANGDSAVRKWATKKLGDLRNPTATDHLIKMLGDQDPTVRDTAAVELGKIGDEKAVEPLLDLLKKHGTQRAAITALGDIGSTKAIGVLEMLVYSDALPRESFRSLLKINASEAHRVAERVLQDISSGTWYTEPEFPFLYPGREKRMAAAEVLIQVDGVKAFPRLFAAVKSGSVEAAEVIHKVMRSHDFSPLIALTQDPNPAPRIAAVIALGTTNDQGIVERLVHLFQHDRNVNVRRAAVLSLSRFDLPATGAVLMGALKNEALLKYALLGLTQHPNTYVIQALLEEICDPDRDVEERKRRASLLGEMFKSQRLTHGQKSLILAKKSCTVYEEPKHSDEVDDANHTDMSGIDYEAGVERHEDRGSTEHTDGYYPYPTKLESYLR